MQKLFFTLICILSLSMLAQGQCSYDTQLRPDFLKRYKAPTFKLARMDVQLDGGGNSSFNNSSQNDFYRSDFALRYQFYVNSPFYQGSVNSSLANRLNFQYDAAIQNRYLQNETGANVRSNNYFFMENGRSYIGLHGKIDDRFVYNNNGGEKGVANRLNANIAGGFGFGRIEPVQYARNAMDIERQLQCNDRMEQNFTESELKSLADQIAKTNNVRFFDFRLRRIEQFQELDSVLQRIGKTTDDDIVYFSALSDAYLYAQYFPRNSGMRNEIGVSGGLSTNHSDANTGFSFLEERYLAYYKFDWYIPQNYTIQHNLNVLALGGFRESQYTISTSRDVPAYLHAGYELGLYPTTRTNFNFGVQGFAGFENNETFVNARIMTNATIYISPRLRISYNVSYSLFDEQSSLVQIDHLNNSSFGLMGGAINNSRFQVQAGIAYAIF